MTTRVRRRGALFAVGMKTSDRLNRPREAAQDGVRAVLHRGSGGARCAECGWRFVGGLACAPAAGRRVAVIRIPAARCLHQRVLRESDPWDRVVVAMRARDGALVDAEVPMRRCREAPSAAPPRAESARTSPGSQ